MIPEKDSLTMARRLLEAVTSAGVMDVVRDEDYRYYFDDPSNWKPYGGREKNWDTVGNQQTNPVGALTELITNGIDAVLLRKAREGGMKDFRSEKAPRSMFEAVRHFFPQVVEGKIINLEPDQRTKLAEQCILIGVKRGERKNSQYPTYTIVDFGEGQTPEAFPNTFLSLGEKNKEGIAFVQGKFNMGSTGSLRFCTRSDILKGHYKLIVSRRYDHDYWGWTLVRVHGVKIGESLPVAEYFAPGGAVPRFRAKALSAFGHEKLGVVKEGSIVRLYEYDIGPNARAVDLGLYNALTVSLLDCALPVQVYDFDANPLSGKGGLREEGIAARTFGGLNIVLRASEGSDDEPEPEAEDKSESDQKATEFVHLVLEEKHEELGHIKILAIGVRKLKGFLETQPARVFYTLNGQTHAFERASFYNTRVGLGDLRNHLVVNVVCDDMDKTALATIFMPDRERKASNNLSRMLEDLVIKALKDDDRLRAYAAEIRRRRATEHVEDDAQTKDFLNELVKLDPDIKELFGLGAYVTDTGKAPGGQKPFEGKKFPTFLKPLNLRSDGTHYIKEVPLNASRRIECGTDASNDYLTRIDSPGWTWCSHSATEAPHSVKLRNGTATYTVRPPKTAEVGDELTVEFGFQDNGRNFEPLKFAVVLRFVEEEKPSKTKPGKRTDTKEKEMLALGMPEFRWVDEKEWSEHSFNEDSGAYVQTGDKTVVHINHDNRFLRMFRIKEKDEGARILHENMFRLGLGILTLSIHKRAAAESQDPEPITRLASSAIAAHIVTVIRRLGVDFPG